MGKQSFDWRSRISAAWRAPNRESALVTAAIALIAFVPRMLTVGRFETNDEFGWMARSEGFGNAIVHLHPSKASASTGHLATMPGVTTMWLATGARVVWGIGKLLGLVSKSTPFNSSPSGLLLAQLFIAVATSLLIALFVRLAWLWAGAIAATVAGLILATEPFFVAHGSVVHVDELTTLFALTGTVAFMLTLEVPKSGVASTRRMSVLAGLLLACAFLSKVSALSFAPGLILVALLVTFSRRGNDPRQWLARCTQTARRLWPGLVAGLVAVLVLWPALWADPLDQLHLLKLSAGQADTTHLTFFLGHATVTPGPGYYFVAAPLRMTPWFLLGALVLGGFALWTSPRARLLALIALPQAAIVSLASQQFDRYALPILALLALIVGIGADAAWHRIDGRLDRAWHRLAQLACAAFALVMFMNTVFVAPYGIAYFNPLLGGSSTAQHAILVGWGEGLERAGAIIKHREGPACNVTIAVNYELPVPFPCGRTVARGKPADYLVLYINDRQRASPEALAAMRARGRLVGTVRVRGLDYVDVYDTRL